MPRHGVMGVLVAVVAIALAALVVLYIRGMAGDVRADPGAGNTLGPAEGGALETGGALNPDEGYRNLPARDMPSTVSEYPPQGPETDNPPPSQR
jgi:hypothetical protein